MPKRKQINKDEYKYPNYLGREQTKTIGHSLTKQSFKNECDINLILAKFQKTGAITHLQNNQPQYGFASAEDFHESLSIVATAQTMFAELPSSIRTKMHNDPAEFLAFVQDPANAAELVEMGLANAPPIEDPKSPPEAPPAASDTPPAQGSNEGN